MSANTFLYVLELGSMTQNVITVYFKVILVSQYRTILELQRHGSFINRRRKAKQLFCEPQDFRRNPEPRLEFLCTVEVKLHTCKKKPKKHTANDDLKMVLHKYVTKHQKISTF